MNTNKLSPNSKSYGMNFIQEALANDDMDDELKSQQVLSFYKMSKKEKNEIILFGILGGLLGLFCGSLIGITILLLHCDVRSLL